MEAVGAKGFTLLEVLVATAILSIGLLAVSQMSISVIRSNARAYRITDATVMAGHKLEGLRNLSYTDSKLNDDGDTTDVGTDIRSNTALFTSPDHTDTCDSGCSLTIGRTLQRAWNVATDTPASGMKTVTVIVGWKDATNRFVALSTIIRE
jgi:type IV pilus modification protein PilV